MLDHYTTGLQKINREVMFTFINFKLTISTVIGLCFAMQQQPH